MEDIKRLWYEGTGGVSGETAPVPSRDRLHGHPVFYRTTTTTSRFGPWTP